MHAALLLVVAIFLLLGSIGIDAMSGYTRFSFEVIELADGIGIVPVAMGLFGMGEVISNLEKREQVAKVRPVVEELKLVVE